MTNSIQFVIHEREYDWLIKLLHEPHFTISNKERFLQDFLMITKKSWKKCFLYIYMLNAMFSTGMSSATRGLENVHYYFYQLVESNK